MRTLLAGFLVACSVPDKQPTAPDAGPDGGGDTTAPETTIIEAPDEFSRQTAATFRFESNDPNATFECAIDGGEPVACTSPFTRTLNDGTHGFVVRAIGANGQSDDSPAEHLWTIDTVAPDTRLVRTPPAADNSVMVTFEFESIERNIVFECSLDGNSFAACESGDSFGPVSDGAHSFSVRARDRAGNVDMSPPIYAWNVDTSTPDTQLIDGPEGAVASTTATFTFVSPDAGGGATFQCSIDGSAFVACSSPRVIAGLDAGEHTFAVRVRDAVGNFDPTPATRTWTVDVSPPNTTIIDGPEGAVAAASASFTFTSNEQGVTYECRIDNQPFAACTSPFNAMNLAQGAHTFAVRATDSAGHTDASPATRSWTIDTIAPEISITAGPAEGGTSGPRVSFEFTVSEGTPQCALDNADFTACSSPFRFNAAAGGHSLRIRAVDQAGNTTTAPRSWTIECFAPDAAGAAGLLHLEDASQNLENSVNGAGAVLGTDTNVEEVDPASITAARFGRGLAFNPLESDVVTWPAGLPPTSEFTIEMWVRADPIAGQRVIFRTADDRVMVRVTAASPTLVRFSTTIAENGGNSLETVTSQTVTAGAWHHVLVSLQQPMLWMWVDGVRTQNDDARPMQPFDFADLALGGDVTFGGALDEVWIAQTPIITDEAALTRFCPL